MHTAPKCTHMHTHKKVPTNPGLSLLSIVWLRLLSPGVTASRWLALSCQSQPGAHTHTHTHTRTHARTHAHTHTHTRKHTHVNTHSYKECLIAHRPYAQCPLIGSCIGSITPQGLLILQFQKQSECHTSHSFISWCFSTHRPRELLSYRCPS